jgi:WD40 repeat protein
MTLRLGPLVFLTTSPLPTIYLEGAAEANGQLLFSPDERWLLAWGDSGHLQVWEVQTCHRQLFFNQSPVRGATIAEHLGGILVAAGNSLLLFRYDGHNFVCQTLVSRVPGLSDNYLPDSPEASVAVSASPNHIVLATRTWIVHLDPITFQVRHYTSLDSHKHRSLESILIRDILAQPSVDIISSLVQDRYIHYLFHTFSYSGDILFQATFASPDFTLIGTPYIRVRPGLFMGSSGQVSQVVRPGTTEILVRPIPLLERDMRFTSSVLGTALAGMKPGHLVSWSVPYGARRFATDDANYSIYLTDDGRFAVLLYCDGPEAPNVTGVLELPTARLMGHCRGHVAGLTPYAFSPSHRYFATLVTDCVANHHPDKLPSGTIVLTELSTENSSIHCTPDSAS